MCPGHGRNSQRKPGVSLWTWYIPKDEQRAACYGSWQLPISSLNRVFDEADCAADPVRCVTGPRLSLPRLCANKGENQKSWFNFVGVCRRVDESSAAPISPQVDAGRRLRKGSQSCQKHVV